MYIPHKMMTILLIYVLSVSTAGADTNDGVNFFDNIDWKTIGIYAKDIGIGCAVGAVVLPAGIMVIIFCLGCTCSGVRLGSAAAGYQSMLGDVEKGSLFACCQSIGSGANCCKFTLIVGFVGAIAGGVIGGFYAKHTIAAGPGALHLMCEGDMRNVTCQSSGDPLPTISWYNLNGTRLQDLPDFEDFNIQTHNISNTAISTLLANGTKDGYLLIIEANNTHGQDQIDWRLGSGQVSASPNFGPFGDYKARLMIQTLSIIILQCYW